MKLSIITVNLNNKDGLQKTIDSVISQTFKDYEWIVIDGGSTDGSKELIEKYSDYITYWVSEPDKGIYNAMNKGIRVAKGEYLLFLNSGDYLYEDLTLDNVFKCNNGADIITGLVLRDNKSELLRHNQSNIIKQLITDTLSHQGTLIKRNLFEKYEYREDFSIVSDWIAWMKWLLKEDCSFQQIDVLVSVQQMAGISSKQKSVLREERKEAMTEIWGARMANELPLLYKNIDYLKGELNIPAVCMLLYLYHKVPVAFSLLYRIISLFVTVIDCFRHKDSYNKFVLPKE